MTKLSDRRSARFGELDRLISLGYGDWPQPLIPKLVRTGKIDKLASQVRQRDWLRLRRRRRTLTERLADQCTALRRRMVRQRKRTLRDRAAYMRSCRRIGPLATIRSERSASDGIGVREAK